MTTKTSKDAQFTLRLPAEMKAAVWESAKKQDIDGVTWIRHAIREKLEREAHSVPDEELEKKIESVLKKMLAELNQ